MRSYSLKIGGHTFTAEILEYSETKVVVELNGNTYEVELAAESSTLPISPRPAPAATQTGENRRTSDDAKKPGPGRSEATGPSDPAATRHGRGAVTAPLPGAVREILVSVGDTVKEDTVVIVLEAMKMENKISARVTGKVTAIPVTAGQTVQEGQLLVDIEVS